MKKLDWIALILLWILISLKFVARLCEKARYPAPLKFLAVVLSPQ